MEIEIWDREQLYTEVWETPLIKLAPKYCISAVALGKVCRKLQIPLPGRGYWAKKEMGKPVVRISLPVVKDLPVVRRFKTTPTNCAKPDGKQVEPPPDDPELIQIASIEAQSFPIDPETKQHKLVVATGRILRHARPDEKGMLNGPWNEPWLDIRVSKSSLNRALLLMNTIVHAIEKEHGTVSLHQEKDRSKATIAGHQIPFSLIEKYKMKDRREVTEGFWTHTVYQYEPNGILEFRVGGSGDWMREIWRDGKKQTLEQQIGKCVGGFLRISRALRIRKEEQRRQEIERIKKQKELDELAEQIKAEERKVQDLEGWVTDWVRARQMREFIAALEAVWTKEGLDLSPDAPKGKRIAWMKLQADRHDPMLPSPPSILDRKQELPRWQWKVTRNWPDSGLGMDK